MVLLNNRFHRDILAKYRGRRQGGRPWPVLWFLPLRRGIALRYPQVHRLRPLSLFFQVNVRWGEVSSRETLVRQIWLPRLIPSRRMTIHHIGAGGAPRTPGPARPGGVALFTAKARPGLGEGKAIPSGGLITPGARPHLSSPEHAARPRLGLAHVAGVRRGPEAEPRRLGLSQAAMRGRRVPEPEAGEGLALTKRPPRLPEGKSAPWPVVFTLASDPRPRARLAGPRWMGRVRVPGLMVPEAGSAPRRLSLASRHPVVYPAAVAEPDTGPVPVRARGKQQPRQGDLIYLTTPEVRPAGMPQPLSATASSQPPATPGAPWQAAPAAPEIDLPRLTEQVYQALERKIRLEKQRRGYR